MMLLEIYDGSAFSGRCLLLRILHGSVKRHRWIVVKSTRD